MRRKPGTLIPIEVSILAAAVDLRAAGEAEFHGYRLAGAIREREQAKLLTSHGTLYKALERLRNQGLLRSHWEDHAIAEDAGRPRRRLYTVTAAGIAALDAHRAAESATNDAPEAGLQPA
jgi:PadR family transcriptional regulator PadR